MSTDPWEEARASALVAINRVAETHFFVRPVLMRALEGYAVTPEGNAFIGRSYANLKEQWQAEFADRFFDMGTLQRLATSVEQGLRETLRLVAGAQGLDRAYEKGQGIFQQLVRPQNLLAIFQAECNYDLTANPAWHRMQVLMAHRHLYAHRSGLIDQKYVDQMALLTDEDLTPALTALNWPTVLTYWFRPLDELPSFIEESRRFFRMLGSDPAD